MPRRRSECGHAQQHSSMSALDETADDSDSSDGVPEIASRRPPEGAVVAERQAGAGDRAADATALLDDGMSLGIPMNALIITAAVPAAGPPP